MADPRVIQQVIHAVEGAATPVSAAMGELAENHDLTKIPKGLTYAKIGLAKMLDRPWHNALMGKFAQLAKISPIAVAYWDCDAVRAPWSWRCSNGPSSTRAAGVLIDTADKARPRPALSGCAVLRGRDQLGVKKDRRRGFAEDDPAPGGTSKAAAGGRWPVRWWASGFPEGDRAGAGHHRRAVGGV